MKNELYTLFYSPIAWLVLIIFAFQAGMAFSDAYLDQLRQQALDYSLYGVTRSLLFGWDGVISSMQRQLYLYIPLLTMGLMSQEYNRGSIKLLYSYPITNKQIIFGKYLAIIVYILVLIAFLFIYILFSLFTIKNMDIPYALAGVLGIFLLLSAYAAIGLFMSTLTSYQVVAAVGTLALLSVLNFINNVGQEIPFIRDITYWLSMSGRSDTFLKGLICSEDVLYFILVIVLFISLSIIKLQAERTKKNLIQNIAHYGCVIILALGIGYASSRPQLMCYYDATETKDNTLTQSSIDVMKKLDGPLTLTTYVNLLSEHYYYGLPKSYNEDIDRFERYIRFKPEIEMKYVYYYHKTYFPLLDTRYPNLNDEERARRISDISNINFSKVLTPEQINQQVDLSGEDYRFVRIFERGNGQKSFLRLFGDNVIFPGETEITASLKRMVVPSPHVAFLSGHGERNIYSAGEQEYAAFAENKTFRYSLLNQGFNISTLSLENIQSIPKEIDILVISDIKKSLSPSELTAISNYISIGGNLIIAGESRRQNNMNPILEQLGLRFMPGILVQQNKDYPQDLILGNIATQAINLTPKLRYLKYNGSKVSMPGAIGIEQISNKGFEIIPLIETDSTGSWNELETTNFIETTATLNPTIGEVEKSIPIALYLSREINGKTQRIIVTGDSDCFSNSELSRTREGIPSVNFTMITESFRLLSNGEFPVDTRRPRPSDDQIYLTENASLWIKLLFIGLLPCSIIILSLGLWWKRRGK